VNISDEQLDAYVDGELPDAQRALVAEAIARDGNLAQRVARQDALRQRLRASFDAVLQEPVPDRLLGLVKGTKSEAVASVTNLTAAREKRRPALGWYAIAASILVGSIAGLLTAQWHAGTDLTTFQDGRLVAHGALATALDQQLASAIPADASVHVGLSFKSRSGRYCRTFDIVGAEGSAGLACYDQQHWRVVTLIGKPAKQGADPVYRMAGSDIPPLLMQSVSENISGEPLDAQAEMRARDSGWH
jgi:hypothetical protein